MSQQGATRGEGDDAEAGSAHTKSVIQRKSCENKASSAGSYGKNGKFVPPMPKFAKPNAYTEQRGGAKGLGTDMHRNMEAQHRRLNEQEGGAVKQPPVPAGGGGASDALGTMLVGKEPKAVNPKKGETKSKPMEPQPEAPLVTLVTTEAQAILAVALLSEVRKAQRIFAVDTETSGVNPTKQSPVGNGKVVCFTVYCGPQVDFKGCGETISLDVAKIEREYSVSERVKAKTGAGPEAETDLEGGGVVEGESPPRAEKERLSTRLWVKTDGEEGEKVFAAFKPWLENPKVKKVFHNWSFDFHVLANHGIRCRGLAGDTVHMARLWDSNRMIGGGYKLSSLCNDLLGWGKVDMKTVFAKGKLKQDGTEGKLMYLPDSLDIQNDDDMFEKWVHYATYDTLCTWHLYHILRKKLEDMAWKPDGRYFSALPGGTGGVMTDPSLSPKEPRDKANRTSKKPAKGKSQQAFYAQCWLPFAEVLTSMERKGIAINIPYLQAQAEVARKDQAAADRDFRDWARSLHFDGEYMNTASLHQKRHLMFGHMTVLLTKDYTYAKGGAKRKFAKGDQVELAHQDGQNLIEAGVAEKVVLHTGDPGLKMFTIENVEGFLLEGRTKPLKTRSIYLAGLTLTPTEYTATLQPSTSGAVIRALAGKPFADPPQYGTAYLEAGGGTKGDKACKALARLLDTESISKLLSTFLETLPTMADAKGRIHTSINLNTETGRLSSMRPNLQNQPALEKDVYKIRKAFTAGPGNRLIVVDYGQLELRIMAHMCGCKSMIDAFKAGGDFHSRTAMDMYGYIQEAVTKGEVLLEKGGTGSGQEHLPLIKDKYASERRKAKTLNFSIAYGKTKVGLAKDWGVTPAEAQATIDAWYAAREEVKTWQDKTINKAKWEGYTKTLLGRRRQLPEINSTNRTDANHSNRAAINTPIQGGAADIVVMAMLKVSRSEVLAKLGWEMVLQVHDELILEGPAESAEEAFLEVRTCMEHPLPMNLDVALPVDGKIVDSWYDAK